MANGTIKRVVADRFFGFIRDESGEEFFFHKSALQQGVSFDNLKEGQRVTYDVGNSAKGPRAENVRVN